MFKVYKRKIHVWEKRGESWAYCWSTNACKTCKEAKTKAVNMYPFKQFKASFAKD
jgi:hypothetical protein